MNSRELSQPKKKKNTVMHMGPLVNSAGSIESVCNLQKIQIMG